MVVCRLLTLVGLKLVPVCSAEELPEFVLDSWLISAAYQN